MSVLNVLRYIATHPLNRDSKFKSIMRFAKWQIGSRLISNAVVYDWINGSRFLVRRGETGLTGNIYVGLHEFPDMAFLLHYLRDDDLFVDVGANVGSYSILACAVVGAHGYAFEPVPRTYNRLVDNMRLNHSENRLRCFNICLGNEEGRIAFTSDMDTMNHVIASGELTDGAIQVEVSTLDTVLGEDSPALIKIDVEGYETPLLEGASEALKKQSLRAVIMELNGSGNRYGFDEARLLKLMSDHDFKSYQYNPLNRSLIDLQGKNSTLANTLFIRDEAFVLDRLKDAPQFNIHGKQI